MPRNQTQIMAPGQGALQKRWAAKRGHSRPSKTVPSAVPPVDHGPDSLVKIIEDDFGDDFDRRDGARNRGIAGQDEADDEGIDRSGDPPAYRLGEGSPVSFVSPKEVQHRDLQETVEPTI